MIYFEFNRRGGKEKYTQMTETAYQQAIQQNDRWFLIFAEDGYALECTQAEHRDYYSRLNHEKNSRRGKDGKYPELLSIERNEVECSSDMSVFLTAIILQLMILCLTSWKSKKEMHGDTRQ